MSEKKTCTLHDDIVYLEKFVHINKYTLQKEYWTAIKPCNRLNLAARTFLKQKADPFNSKTQYAYWSKKETAYLCKYYIGDVAKDLRQVVDDGGHRVFKVTLDADAFAVKKAEVEEAMLEDMTALEVAMYRQNQTILRDGRRTVVGDIIDYDDDEIESDF